MLGLARRMLGTSGGEEKASSPSEADQSETGPKLPLASRHLRFEAGTLDAEHDKVSEPPGLTSPAAGAETPGSRHHGEGECNPCAWYWKPQGCLRGRECGYCHLCPDGEVKLRKKAKLAAMRGGSSPTSPSSTPAKQQKDDSETEAVVDRQPMTSIGSALHGTGECKPCAWFWKPKGCQNGAECRHCHLCPQGEIRQRKKSKDKNAKDDEQVDAGGYLGSLPLEPLKVQLPESHVLDLPDLTGDLQEPQKVAPSPTSTMGADTLPTFQPPPGLAPASTVPSVGSAEHGTGRCRPCAWLWRPGGCENGAECRHCHLCPEGEIKARRKVKAETARLEQSEDLTTPMALSLAEMLSPEGSDEDAIAPLRLSDSFLDPFSLTLPLEGSAEQEARVFPSEGSRLHGTGYCRPCAWFWKPKGCENGKECRHCHLCPQEEIKHRRKAKQMLMHCDQGSPSMMWPGLSTPTPASMDSMGMTQTPASVFPSDFSDSLVLSESLGLTPLDSSPLDGYFDAFGAASPSESPKLPIELANFLPVPSAGSTLHGTGKCRPCAWFHKSSGCSNGEACAHCHLCPEDEIRNRKKAKEAALRAGALEPKKDADSRNPRTVRIAPLLTAS
mmetsp:Transcript_54734/g.127731  ORF Transcript_54734/g.127731 Transcript_54734/m.127731 type:complete len:613 (-) Transcript_54734:158-1996(-)